MVRWSVVVALVLSWWVFLAPPMLGGGTSLIAVAGESMEPTLRTEDVVVVRRSSQGYGRGDIVAYRIPAGDAGAGHVVIHRVVGGNGTTGYVVRGDNKELEDVWRPRDEDVLGRQWLTIDGAGRLGGQLGFLPPVLAGLASALIVLGRREEIEDVEKDEEIEAAV